MVPFGEDKALIEREYNILRASANPGMPRARASRADIDRNVQSLLTASFSKLTLSDRRLESEVVVSLVFYSPGIDSRLIG